MIEKSIGASSFAEVAEARDGIERWMQAHPDDESMDELQEHLLRLEYLLGHQTPEPVGYNTTLPSAR